MGFDRGIFLWGLLAIAIPIIIYLLFRQKYQRIPWAAMEFLLAAIRKNKRRLQIENLLLLIIRILIIIMLVGALAKPMLEKESALAKHVKGSENVIILIDVSYSMGYRTGMRSSFEKAQQVAKKIISNLERGDNIAIVPFHRSVQMREVEPIPISDVRTKRALTAEIDSLAVSAYPTSVAAAFEACETLFKKLPGAHVYLFTDFTRFGWTRRSPQSAGEAGDEALGAIQNPALTNILSRLAKHDGFFTFVDVGPSATAPNCTVASFQPEDSLTVTDFIQTFMVRVKNNGDEPVRGTLTFRVDGTDAGRHAIEIKPRAETAFPLQFEFREPGSHSLETKFDSDNLVIDNERFLVIEVEKAVRALLISGEKIMGGSVWGDNEVDFVRVALNPNPDGSAQRRVSVIATKEIEPEELHQERLENYSFIVAANVGSLNEYEIGRLERFVSDGGGMLVFAGELVQPENYNSLFWHDEERGTQENGEKKEGDARKPPSLLPAKLLAPVMDETGRNPYKLKLELPDHPCFSTDFPMPKAAAFARASFRKFLQTKVESEDRDVRVLARFTDSGRSPAVLERIYGRGKVIMVTTTADIEWNRWAPQPAFIAFIQDCARYLAAGRAQRKTLMVGEPFEAEFPEEEWAEEVELRNPRDETEPKDLLKVERDGKRFYRLEHQATDLSGIYTLSLNRPKGEEETAYFAANVEPGEGDLEKVTESDVRGFAPGTFTKKERFSFRRYAESDETEEAANEPATKRPHMWFYFLIAALGLLVVETILAQRFGARRKDTDIES